MVSVGPGARLGAYQIVESLGAGGMGHVFKARDERLARDVAIKVLPPHLSSDPVLRERLRREAIAAAQLDHPFICKVIEVADLDGHLFVVMELVIGQTLHTRLREPEPVSLGEAVAWTIEVAEALETAHERQIVHRDLKPSNVMVSSQGHIKVMDFGLAKGLGPDANAATRTLQGDWQGPLTGQGMRVGTPGYMSPEQIVGEELDVRSDIFSLGVVLCELAGGSHPFRRSTVAATNTAILRSDPVIVPTTPGAEIPAALRVIIQRMLAKSPAARYQSMREVRRDLQGLVSGGVATGHWGALGGARWAASDRIGQARRWPMVGRESEQAELIDRLDAAISGHGGLVLVGGEPGIGKTRLAESVLDAGRARGCMALVGHAYEMEGMQPYTPFIEMLEYSARVVPSAALRHALGDSAAEVAKLFPELRRIFPDIPPPLDVPPEQQRRVLFNAYRAFVERSCRMAPIVCVLEDLHWADDASLQLLMHLAPSLADWPLLIIGTYRDVELDVTRPFARVLETLVRQRQGSRIALRRLPAEEVHALLSAMSDGQAPPASLARVIFNETEGNPFFVEEVFQHLREEGRLFEADGAWKRDLRVESLEVPEGVRLVIGRRLGRLSDASRKVLTSAAVIGRTFSLPLLEAVEDGAGADAVLDAVEEAERAHLISPQRVGREARYLFAHELIRQTLAEGLSMPRRQRLHARIADAVERVYGASVARHASVLAHHLYQAGAAVDPMRASDWLVKAADEAWAAAAGEEFLRVVDQALTLWEGERSARVADLFERRGFALRSLARGREACDALAAACELWDPAVDSARLLRTTFELSMTHLWQGEVADSRRVVDRTRERLVDATEVQRYSLQLMRSFTAAGAGDAENALAWWTEAQAAMTRLQDPALDAIASGMEAHFRWVIMDLGRAHALAAAAVERNEAAGRAWYAADVAWITVFCEYFLGRFPTLDRVRELRDKARRIGQGSPGGVLQTLEAYLLYHHGRLQEAEATALLAHDYNTTVNNRWGLFAPLFAGVVAFVQGRVDDGIAGIRAAEALEPPGTYWLGMARRCHIWALAHVAPQEARARLAEEPLVFPVARRANAFGAWTSLTALAPALVMLGDRDVVASQLPAAEELVTSDVKVVSWWCVSPTLAGLVAGCAGRWDQAEDYFEQALSLAAQLPSRTEAANARRWYADMLMLRGRPGDRDRARTLLGESEALADDIGLKLLAQQARDMRLKLG